MFLVIALRRATDIVTIVVTAAVLAHWIDLANDGNRMVHNKLTTYHGEGWYGWRELFVGGYCNNQSLKKCPIT